MPSHSFIPCPIPPHLRVSAAERLVATPDRHRAARRLIDDATKHGIDLNLLWGTIDPDPKDPFVRQAVLAVPSAGRTGMLFLSPPAPERRYGPDTVQFAELTDTLRTVNRDLPAAAPTPVTMTQALIEPQHAWAEAACRDAGMLFVGRLHFMRMPWRGSYPAPANATPWPDGITVETVDDALDFTPDGSGTALAAALEASYENTLDCPELCGLRSTHDVIASHMATGQYNPNRWWILREHGRPEACCLLNESPLNRSVELVYLGLSSRVRGRGLARTLLEHALSQLRVPASREVTCAVDTRNSPALKLYHAMGFRAFSARLGFVCPLASGVIETKPLERVTPGGQGGSFGTSGGQENLDGAKRL